LNDLLSEIDDTLEKQTFRTQNLGTSPGIKTPEEELILQILEAGLPTEPVPVPFGAGRTPGAIGSVKRKTKGRVIFELLQDNPAGLTREQLLNTLVAGGAYQNTSQAIWERVLQFFPEFPKKHKKKVVRNGSLYHLEEVT